MELIATENIKHEDFNITWKETDLRTVQQRKLVKYCNGQNIFQRFKRNHQTKSQESYAIDNLLNPP